MRAKHTAVLHTMSHTEFQHAHTHFEMHLSCCIGCCYGRFFTTASFSIRNCSTVLYVQIQLSYSCTALYQQPRSVMSEHDHSMIGHDGDLTAPSSLLEPTVTGGELITLQLGNYANYVATHYWNIQHELLQAPAVAATAVDPYTAGSTTTPLPPKQRLLHSRMFRQVQGRVSQQ